MTATVIAHGTKVVRAGGVLQVGRRDGLGPHTDARGARRARSVRRHLRRERAGSLGLRRRGVDRSVRALAGRAPPQAAGRTDGPLGGAVRRRADRRPVVRHCRRGAEGRRRAARGPHAARAHLRDRRRPAARALRGVVRAVPPLVRRAEGGRSGVAAPRRARLRRRVPASHPPHRPDEPQGSQQQPPGRARGSRQPVGHRFGRRRTHRGARRAGDDRRLRPPRHRGARRSASRSRSTSRSRRRPTIPGSRSIPSGSGADPTAA